MENEGRRKKKKANKKRKISVKKPPPKEPPKRKDAPPTRNIHDNAAAKKSKHSANEQDTNELPPCILEFDRTKARFGNSLSDSQVLLWRQKFASTACIYNCFPNNHLRLLGTITFQTTQKKLKQCAPGGTIFVNGPGSGLTPPTMAAARKLAVNEIQNGIIDAEQKETRALEICELWRKELRSQNYVGNRPWDRRHNLLEIQNVQNFLYLKNVLSLQDDLDDNLQQVFEAIEDMKEYCGIWKIPILHVLPFYEKINGTNQIQLAIYAHRLLFEVNHICLKTIMENLDEESYKITCPLQTIPEPDQETFASSEYPKVLYDEKPEENDDSPNKNYLGDIHDDKTISAFSTDGLLKILENKGTDTTQYDKVADQLDELFQFPLLLHQKHAISWMIDMEKLGGFGINSLLWEEREFWDGGKYYYSPKLGQIRLDKPATLTGGLVCDEMGLGKTFEVLGLILATLPQLRKATHNRHSTLIIVPPALVAQWQNEIKKACGDSLVVDYYDYKTMQFTRDGKVHSRGRLGDIVLTTYNALDKKNVANHLNEKNWGRVVLDEFQEVRSTTSQIAKRCEKLQCSRRWMLSGTPLFDGIDDLKGELNFLRLEPFSANSEDGFFNFMVKNGWENREKDVIDVLTNLSSVMLRRSKAMTIVENGDLLLGLPELTVEYHPVHQSSSERAIYYFLESIVAREMRGNEQTASGRKAKKVCLKLLRDMCNSSVLINGGLGVPSQLQALNRLLLQQARSEYQAKHGESTDAVKRVMNCDEAIMHLAQIQESTRAGVDQVAGLALGFGQGVSRRVRATATAEEKLEETERNLNQEKCLLVSNKQQRAKLRWQWVLQKVTTGALSEEFYRSSASKYRCLWRWRSCFEGLDAAPTLLNRGWQASEGFVEALPTLHPEYFWVHENTLTLGSIPEEVTASQIQAAILEVLVMNNCFASCASSEDGTKESEAAKLVEFLVENDCSNLFELFKLGTFPAQSKDHPSSTWSAGLRFNDLKHAAIVLKVAAKDYGIPLRCAPDVPQAKRQLAKAEAAYEKATEANNIHPSVENENRKTEAKKEFDAAKKGLRMVHCLDSVDSEHVLVTSSRLVASDFHQSCDEMSAMLDSLRLAIDRNEECIHSLGQNVERLAEACRRDSTVAIATMSAFETLEAISNGNREVTTCSICLDSLGETTFDSEVSHNEATISMTKCGHLFCRYCLDHYMGNRHYCHCPECRKEITSRAGDVVFINPAEQGDRSELRKRMKAAKNLVRTASRMLEESEGMLSPEMWDQLYLSIDEPKDVCNSLDKRISAVPRHFLAHMRACTGMPIHNKQGIVPDLLSSTSGCISTKIQCLLRDLPTEERSVVFSASKATIHHLEFVLKKLNIGCRSLFSGQKVECTERAVADWQQGYPSDMEMDPSSPFPVLLVQAGAAASGLTLTAACKMFFMEPFLRYSEEQQAYGRCHRYSQTRPVVVKCYFAPVSVESRLLKWRKLTGDTAAASSSNDGNRKIAGSEANIVFSGAVDRDEDEFVPAQEDEELEQEEFLLGMHGDARDTRSP